MDLRDYEKFVDAVWMSTPDRTYSNEWEKKYYELKDLFVMTTGLGGESGEALEKIKKYVRDLDMDGAKFDKNSALLEFGDALYYIVKLAHKFGYTMDDVIIANYKKLASRLQRGTMRGSGDYR